MEARGIYRIASRAGGLSYELARKTVRPVFVELASMSHYRLTKFLDHYRDEVKESRKTDPEYNHLAGRKKRTLRDRRVRNKIAKHAKEDQVFEYSLGLGE